jgi:hypothetical protein
LYSINKLERDCLGITYCSKIKNNAQKEKRDNTAIVTSSTDDILDWSVHIQNPNDGPIKLIALHEDNDFHHHMKYPGEVENSE